MCGILIISQNNDININNLESIKNVLNHRPDGSNYLYKNIFLLHNRLSIIDLTYQINHYLIIKKFMYCSTEKFIIT